MTNVIPPFSRSLCTLKLVKNVILERNPNITLGYVCTSVHFYKTGWLWMPNPTIGIQGTNYHISKHIVTKYWTALGRKGNFQTLCLLDAVHPRTDLTNCVGTKYNVTISGIVSCISWDPVNVNITDISLFRQVFRLRRKQMVN